MKGSLLPILLAAFSLSGCATTNMHPLKVESVPSDALISVHKTKEPSAERIRTVAGTTPVDKPFDFTSENSHLWLEIEKRGYAPQQVEVTPETKTLNVKLERLMDGKGEPVKEYAVPQIKRLLVVDPEIEVINRGFASEKVGAEESTAAKEGIAIVAQSYFSGKYEVARVRLSQEDAQQTRSVLRDARTAMELVDPIRLKYLAAPQFLETKSAREAAKKLGSRHGGEALLLICGKQNLETAGMVLGKIGLFSVGTAASFGSAYASAVANGDTWFVYNIYIPTFSQGTLLKAALIDCATGEILWVNKGLWGKVKFDDFDEMGKVATDLFANLPK